MLVSGELFTALYKPCLNRCLCFQQNGSGLEGLGQVSYEESGEFFFLPFSAEDVEGMARLKVTDQVTFCIARDKRYVGQKRKKLLREYHLSHPSLLLCGTCFYCILEMETYVPAAFNLCSLQTVHCLLSDNCNNSSSSNLNNNNLSNNHNSRSRNNHLPRFSGKRSPFKRHSPTTVACTTAWFAP